MPLSVKTKEHFRRRMALAGPKWGALMGGAVALAGVIMFTTSALHFVTVTDTHGSNTRILTVNQTEAAVLAQAGVAPLGENDRIVTSDTPDGELMQVLRAYTVPVTADGQTQEIINWFLKNYSAKELDEQLLMEDPDLSGEELSLKRFELIQDFLITGRDIPDQSYADSLCETLYTKLYDQE